jgi:hypothetical protein
MSLNALIKDDKYFDLMLHLFRCKYFRYFLTFGAIKKDNQTGLTKKKKLL